MKLIRWLMPGSLCCLLLICGNGCVTRTVTNAAGSRARGLGSRQPGEVKASRTIWIWQHEFWDRAP